MLQFYKALLAASVFIVASSAQAAVVTIGTVPKKEDGLTICLRNEPRWGGCADTVVVPWDVVTAYIRETGSRDLSEEDKFLNIFYKGWKSNQTFMEVK